MPGFPQTRLRRNRRHDWSRRLVRENRLTADDLIWPVFVHDADGTAPVSSMPGVLRYGLGPLVDAVGQAKDLGIPAVALFPKVDAGLKTPDAAEATNPENLVCRAIRAVTSAHPDIGVIADAALDPYNSDGHDGVLRDGDVVNDDSVEILVRQSVAQAAAGCHVIAPSDMMDGRVAAIRRGLDEAGYGHVQIMAYAAKYASAFYGPFRDAIDTGGYLKGDKRTYQLDPANADEALREVAFDLDEGADMVIVKPGLPYLDIIRRVKHRFAVPTYTYNVSGEYAMVQFAAEAGAIDRDAAMLEMLLGFKRAGADGVLTYFAVDAARLLRAG